jgi:uncharacterized membrane protein
VIYALRKLIAFVFLGGMFWFIYQDLGNLGKPWFMHALGLIAIAFAFFWLLIPMIVVWFRIRRRRAQNQERYEKWLADGGVGNICERQARNARLDLEPGDWACFHEKGTLYVENVKKKGGEKVGRPSDVAFPGYRRNCHVCQRTHCYMTNRRLAFAGKDLDIRIFWEELKKFTVTPGGIVFEAACSKQVAANCDVPATRLAFTFQNPLVAADVLRFAKGERAKDAFAKMRNGLQKEE